jgi:hypothetical protein
MGRLADANRAAKAKFNGAGLIAKPNQKRAGPPPAQPPSATVPAFPELGPFLLEQPARNVGPLEAFFGWFRRDMWKTNSRKLQKPPTEAALLLALADRSFAFGRAFDVFSGKF